MNKILFLRQEICVHCSSFRCLILQPQLQLFSCSCSCSWSKKIRIFHEIITLDDHFIVRDSRKQLFNTRKCLKMAKNACFVLQLQLQLQLNSCSCGCSRRRQNELWNILIFLLQLQLQLQLNSLTVFRSN